MHLKKVKSAFLDEPASATSTTTTTTTTTEITKPSNGFNKIFKKVKSALLDESASATTSPTTTIDDDIFNDDDNNMDFRPEIPTRPITTTTTTGKY